MTENCELAAIDSPLARRAELLLAERAKHADLPMVRLPGSVAATGLVAWAEDPARYALELRRPVPREPTRTGRRGTLFHAWVENYFQQPATLGDADFFDSGENSDDDENLGDFIEFLASDAGDDIDELRQAFMRSPWSQPCEGRRLVGTEVDVEASFGGTSVRCRIDAVFTYADGNYEIVDWKTGRPPADEAGRRHRAIQLAVYRAAFAQWSGIAPHHIRAVLYYVISGTTLDVDKIVDQIDVARLIEHIAGT